MDFPTLHRVAKKQGWTITITGGGHLKWCPPTGGEYYISSATCSDMHAIYHVLHSLRKLGLVYPVQTKKTHRHRRATLLHMLPFWQRGFTLVTQ
jgi:hypothetical protein